MRAIRMPSRPVRVKKYTPAAKQSQATPAPTRSAAIPIMVSNCTPPYACPTLRGMRLPRRRRSAARAEALGAALRRLPQRVIVRRPSRNGKLHCLIDEKDWRPESRFSMLLFLSNPGSTKARGSGSATAWARSSMTGLLRPLGRAPLRARALGRLARPALDADARGVVAVLRVCERRRARPRGRIPSSQRTS